MFLQILVKFWSGYGSLKFRVLGGYGGWDKFVFGQMCDFRDAPTTLRMPFPCLVSKILRSKNVLARKYHSNDPLSPKDMDSSILTRSRAQVKIAEGSLLTAPPPSASTKTWLEKIIGCVTGLARGQRKLKREQRQLAKNQMDLMDRQRHLEAQLVRMGFGL